MPWIESHSTLPNHPKTKRLARALGIGIPQAVGHLHCLWYYCIEFADDGDLSNCSNQDVADAALYDGDPDRFVQALQEAGGKGKAGFLEGMAVHDWFEYAGKLVDRRERNKVAMRAARERMKTSRVADVLTTLNERDAMCRATVPTVPTNQTNQPTTANPDTGLAQVAGYYQDAGFGMVSPIMIADIDSYRAEHGMTPDLIVYAIELASAGPPDAKKWSYVRGVLERFRKSGFKTRSEAEANDKARRTQTGEVKVETVKVETPEAVKQLRRQLGIQP